MAGNPPCMSEDGSAAVFVGTLLDTGASITVCPDCLLSFCMSVVESNTGIPIAELVARFPAETDQVVETPPAVDGDGEKTDEPERDDEAELDPTEDSTPADVS